jgi:CheY-like chemotaxis protein
VAESDAPLRLLVIEDEDSIAQLVAHILRREGYEVELAPDGQAGLEAARARRPDLVLCDLMIPRVHGFEVIRSLRSAPMTRRLPIIVLSAKSYAPDRRKALELGASAFLPKPFQADELVALVKRTLSTPRVRFWGVRGSIATPGPDTIRYGGNTPCATIEMGRDTLVLDCGTGARPLGITLQAESRGVPLHVRMLITHTHWDHIQGFPFFVPAFVPGNQVDVYGPPSMEKPLEKVLSGQMDPAYFPVSLGEMAANIRVHEVREPTFEFGPWTVQALYVNHPGVTMAYRISAHGKTIVYATDTEPFATLLVDSTSKKEHKDFARERDEALLEFVRDADLYIADSQYTVSDYQTKKGWGHTCYVDAVQMAMDGGAKRIALFSHDPMHDDEAVDRKVADCKRIVSEAGSPLQVIPAIEGECIELDDVEPA